MKEEKKAPVIVGPPIDPGKDPVLSRYKGGIAARAEEARRNKPKMGNIAQADASFKPGRDAPMTIAQMTEAQRRIDSADEKPSGLSKATIDGMNAIAKAAEASRQQKAQQPPQPTIAQPKEKKKMEETPKAAAPPNPEPTPAQKKQAEKVSAAVSEMDDYELERIMRGIQNDVINNTKERDHVNNPENKRLSEVDFATGIATGEFKQIVDVIPGRMKVHYRTMTPMENQAIRLWIFDRVAKDPRLDKVSGEMYGLSLIVAQVEQVNGSKYPDHLTRTGAGGVYSANFNEEAWSEKYDMFARMPQPLIHALGVHGQWFDVRVREMFTADHAKNG
jgi:hypothetical protein